MLQQDSPDDYVVATGETHTVKEFVQVAFDYLKLDWNKHVVVDEKFYRPSEVNILCGDYSKANRILKWEPKVKFKDLVKIMVDVDFEFFKKQNIKEDKYEAKN